MRLGTNTGSESRTQSKYNDRRMSLSRAKIEKVESRLRGLKRL